MATTVKKTYHKRTRTIASVSSSSPVPLSPRASSKRAREEDDGENIHPTKRQNTTVKILSTITNKNKQPPPSKKPQRKPLTQLQLAFSAQPALRSCNLCGLSYTRGTPEDESLHRSHCARVTKGMEWGRERRRRGSRAGVSVVQDDVKLKGGEHGRIISFRADVSGKIGTKVSGRQVAEEQDI
jgi:N-acetyltransferase